MRHNILKQFILFLAIILGSYTAIAGQDTVKPTTKVVEQPEKYNYKEEFLEEIKVVDKIVDEETGEEVEKLVVPQIDNTHQETSVSDSTIE